VTILLLTPAVLSLLILAAHFLRHGRIELVLLALAFVGLLAVPRAWAARALQGALVAGAAEWVRTLHRLWEVRAAAGMPATRMALILGVVAAVTLLSALAFQAGPLKRHFRLVG
jgi:hypothetical protein